MSNLAPVNSWDSRVFIGKEGAYPANFGTPPTPTAAMAREFISMGLGPSGEVGGVRAKKDRNPGRGMTNAYVEGRVGPIPVTGQTTVKSRAAHDTVPQEDALYAAAGLKQTVNASTSVTYGPVADPVEDADFQSMAIYRVFGPDLASYEAEWVRGVVVKSLKWSGGDKEVMLDITGAGIGKAVVGFVASVTLDISQTTLSTVSTEECYRINNAVATFGHVYMKCESEVIDITAVSISTHTLTFTRAALSSSAAAHTGKPLYPYQPLLTGYTGSPIAEPNCTVTIDGVTYRALSWEFNLKQTGMDLLPGETGSKHVQGVKTLRYDAEARMKLVLKADDVSLEGKVTARNTVAWSFSQGTGTGATFAIGGSYAEVMPFVVPDTAGDTAIVDVQLRLMDSSAGNDMFLVTLT